MIDQEPTAAPDDKYQRQLELTKLENFVLLSPMRNEGPFILEWLAWHKSVGFDEVLIMTNNCTDGSDALLDHLARQGHVLHARHTPASGQFALTSAFKAAKSHPVMDRADRLMILDADEFLVVHIGDHTVQALIARYGFKWLGMAVHWKCFGDNGREFWSDGMVREDFTCATNSDDPANMRFKSIFQEPENFSELRSHAPFDYLKIWGRKMRRWVDSNGQVLKAVRLFDQKIRRATQVDRITHESAQINHYVMKSRESLSERRAKWESSGKDVRYGDEFFERYNKNDVLDITATKNTTRFDADYARLKSDPETMRLHHACCAAYAYSLAKLANKNPEQDARYIHHLART